MGPRNRHPQQKAKDFSGTIRKLFVYLKPFKIRLPLVIIAAVISAVFTIFAPQLIGDMTNAVANGLKMTAKGPVFAIDLAEVSRIGFILIGLYILSATFNYLQSWVMSYISQRITFNLREQLSKKIARLPLSYFDKTETGDIVSLVTNDLEIVGQNLSQSLVQIITSTVTLIGVAIMMLRISWEMTLIAVVIVPISLALISFIMKSSQNSSVISSIYNLEAPHDIALSSRPSNSSPFLSSI